MSSPQSPYHVLRRLLSICYNSPLETSSFYANLLYDLFAEDLLKGVELDVCCLDLRKGSTNGALSATQETAGGKEGTKGKGKSVSRSSQKEAEDDAYPPSRSDPESSTPHGQPIIVKKLKVHPHLAIHLQAWIHIGAKEYYSAIHLVRDRVYYDQSSKRKGYSSSNTYQEVDDELGSLLPFDGARDRVQMNHQSCLECAMIVAEACQALGRYEEGRRLLKLVHESTAKANRDSSKLYYTGTRISSALTYQNLHSFQISASRLQNHQRSLYLPRSR